MFILYRGKSFIDISIINRNIYKFTLQIIKFNYTIKNIDFLHSKVNARVKCLS